MQSEMPASEMDVTASLEKSGLSLEQGELIKRKGNTVIGRHSLASVHSIELGLYVEKGVIFLAVLFGIAAAACKLLITDSSWSWGCFVLLMFIALLFFAGAFGKCVKIQSKHGEASYLAADPHDHVQSFVMTVREAMARLRRSNG